MKKDNYVFDEKVFINAMKKAFTTNTNVNEKMNEKKQPRKLTPEWQLATMIRRKFLGLPPGLQTTQNTRLCMESIVASHPHLCPDPMRYRVWLSEEAHMLACRTWDFKDVCKEAKIENNEAVAQHLILEGKRVCNDIRINGLAAYGGNIKMFTEKLIDIDGLLKPKPEQEQEEGHE